MKFILWTIKVFCNLSYCLQFEEIECNSKYYISRNKKKTQLERWKRQLVLLQLWKSFYLSKKFVSPTFNKHTCVQMHFNEYWSRVAEIVDVWIELKLKSLSITHGIWEKYITSMGNQCFSEKRSCLLQWHILFLLERFWWLVLSPLTSYLDIEWNFDCYLIGGDENDMKQSLVIQLI